MAYEAYVELDEMTAEEEPVDSFANEQKSAHAPGVLIILQSVLQISNTQFKRNASWISPMLSSLSVCNDRNIRKAVKLVYDEHLNPLVIAAYPSVK